MADYYPPTWFGQYDPNVIQGIVGGIPTRSGGNIISVVTYGWDESASASTNTTAFSDALTASAAGDIISIPAGTFNVTALTIGAAGSNRTIRGAGRDLTIIKPTSTVGITVFASTDFGNVFNPKSLVTSMTSGSAVVTVADGSGFPSPSSQSQYRIAKIALANEPDTPVLSVYGYEFVRTPTVCMVSRSGNNITLSQPLPDDFSESLAVGTCYLELAFQVPTFCAGVGIEDLTVDGSSSGDAMQEGVLFSGCDNCWALNVKSVSYSNRAFKTGNATNIEIRHCWGVGPGGLASNHAGWLCDGSSYCLIENNILVDNFPDIEVNQGSMCNVVAYNYIKGFLDTNHGSHNSYNLYEGNFLNSTSGYMGADGFFGGQSQDTVRGNCIGLVPQWKRFSRQNNMVGNVFVDNSGTGEENWGTPNIGNNSYNGDAEHSTGNDWLDWDTTNEVTWTWPGSLTTRTSDTAGVITLDTGLGTYFATALAGTSANGRLMRFPNASPASNGELTVTSVVGDVVTFTSYSGTLPTAGEDVNIFGGYAGFQELDLDVENTINRKANYYFFTDDIPAGESISPDTLPPSYFRTSKPAYFESLPWPPYDPFNPQVSYDGDEIPAGYLYNHGVDPPSGNIVSTGISGLAKISGTVTIQHA